MKMLTSFTKLTTGEGIRVAYTYSVVDEQTGTVISQNNKGNFIAMDDSLKNNIADIEAFISENFLSE